MPDLKVRFKGVVGQEMPALRPDNFSRSAKQANPLKARAHITADLRTRRLLFFGPVFLDLSVLCRRQVLSAWVMKDFDD